MKPTRYTDSVNCAIAGIIYAAKSQKHMRNHFLAALVILGAVLFLRVSSLEFILLVVSVSFVLFAELVNTAIELCVDIVSPDYHPLAKAAKDVAAGAVLTAAIGAAVMGYLILSRYIFPFYKEALGMIGTPTEVATLVAILSVIIMVVIFKACAGKGTPLEGGSVSGHAAVAFAIVSAVSFTTQDPISSLLTLVLALMVSHSRITLGLHTLREVSLGAIFGTALTLAVLIIFAALK
ncbi:MAG: diacylglycerol kinase [Geobacteraceae bacterium]